MNKDGPIVIQNPAKPWWPGDPRVEPFMPQVREAIARHLPWPSQEFTDIYNRAYEAVYNAIVKYAQEQTMLATPTQSRCRRRSKKHGGSHE